jgi:hypothetical protein
MRLAHARVQSRRTELNPETLTGKPRWQSFDNRAFAVRPGNQHDWPKWQSGAAPAIENGGLFTTEANSLDGSVPGGHLATPRRPVPTVGFADSRM